MIWTIVPRSGEPTAVRGDTARVESGYLTVHRDGVLIYGLAAGCWVSLRGEPETSVPPVPV